MVWYLVKQREKLTLTFSPTFCQKWWNFSNSAQSSVLFSHSLLKFKHSRILLLFLVTRNVLNFDAIQRKDAATLHGSNAFQTDPRVWKFAWACSKYLTYISFWCNKLQYLYDYFPFLNNKLSKQNSFLFNFHSPK